MKILIIALIVFFIISIIWSLGGRRYELVYLKSNYNPFRLLKTFNKREWKISPFHGIHVFEGAQGEGKTLTLIRFIKSMTDSYPDITVLSNVEIGDIPYIEWTTPFQLIHLIQDNDLRGCIIVIDELNVVFPSTDKPSTDWLELVCMLRHYELYVCGTAQVFNRIAKYMREQTTYITNCRIPFKGMSWNRTFTIDSEKMLTADDSGDVKSALNLVDSQIYFHHISDYDRYDSHATIKLLNKEI